MVGKRIVYPNATEYIKLYFLFSVKLKQQSNGQAVGSSYFGAYGATINSAQTAQYPYGMYSD